MKTLRVCLIGLLSIVPMTSGVMAASTVDAKVAEVTSQVVAWRRDIHEHPELGNNEIRTAALVAKHLQSLGLVVKTGIAKTGVLGILKGAKPGPVIALRADMDALPMRENTGLPFASKKTAMYMGETVPVAHSCGHDAHTAMLMGAASVLTAMQPDLAGTVLFVFQPAEEGPPPGETGGAPRMLDEGVFRSLKPDAMFALHVEPGPVGLIDTRPKGFLAGATVFTVKLEGEGTHAARPWKGTDLISLSADIVEGLARLAGREVNILEEPSVISVGRLQAGTRSNILPATAEMSGTIRTFSVGRLRDLRGRMERLVQTLADGYGANAKINFSDYTPATVNDPALLRRIMPALSASAGDEGVNVNAVRRSAAEDFAFFAKEIPAVYAILGSTPNFTSYAKAPANHSPRFDIDEAVLPVGVATHVRVALEYLSDR